MNKITTITAGVCLIALGILFAWLAPASNNGHWVGFGCLFFLGLVLIITAPQD